MFLCKPVGPLPYLHAPDSGGQDGSRNTGTGLGLTWHDWLRLSWEIRNPPQALTPTQGKKWAHK